MGRDRSTEQMRGAAQGKVMAHRGSPRVPQHPVRSVVERWTEGGHYTPLRRLERLECGHVLAAAEKGWSRHRHCPQCPLEARRPILRWREWGIL
jgi:hypothetical protein